MTLRPLAVLVLGSLVVACLGCGGGSSPPLTPDVTPQGDGGPETFGEVNPADLAELDAGGGTGAATPPAPAAETPPSPPPVAEGCTSVGVDFEKRARPKLKECYATARKKEPDLQGTVKIGVDIDTSGKVKSIKVLQKTLPESVAQCMLKVVKTTPLPEAAKCAGKSFTIPVTFPTPH